MQKADNFTKAILYNLKAPIITMPGWESAITKTMVTGAKVHRFSEMVYEKQMATDYEAALYLMTLSLTKPLTNEMFRLYKYTMRKYFPHMMDLVNISKEEPLTDNEKEDLVKLKKWIFKQQMEQLKKLE